MYYIGLEDLVANVMIEILDKKQEQGSKFNMCI